jgi:hypothetical protein
MPELSDLARRIAEPREHAVELLAPTERAHGVTFAEELREWIRLFERFELETIEPSYTELRAPDALVRLKTLVALEEPSRIAQLIGVFVGASVIGQQDDLSYLAAWAPAEGGVSKVYHFHPEDWGLWPSDPALAVRLFRLLQEDKAELAAKRLGGEEEAVWRAQVEGLSGRSSELDPRLDPVRLFPRVAWLVHVLLPISGDWTAELASAATISDFERERELLAERPNLALYWSWAHYMLGNEEELAITLRALEATTCPLVAESVDLIRRLARGEDVMIGERTRAVLEAFREQLQEEAPPAVFGARARVSREARERSTAEQQDEESRLQAALVEVAERDPRVAEALSLLEHFEQGGALRPAYLRAKTGKTPVEAVDHFASLIDGRFKTLITLKLRRAARYPDSSPHATWGLIIAFAQLAKGFDEFHAGIEALGTGNFGARRMTELHRAYGRFSDRRATAKLVEWARAHLAEIESWDPRTPSEAIMQLFSRDVPETQEIIAELLEKASFSGANAALCLHAAEAAGRLGKKRASTGLRRAITLELGRVDDGSRTRVIGALAQCEGKKSLPFLRSLFDARLARWNEESDREGSYAYHHKEIACLLFGLLPLAPEDATLVDKAREILTRFRAELAPDKKPRRDLIYATAALLRGIGNGRVKALADDVRALETLEFREDRATTGLREELTNLVTVVVRELAR